MGKSVWPADGLLSVLQGLAEGETEVTGLCPSVFACVAAVCVRACVHASLSVCCARPHLCTVCTRIPVLLARNVP